MSIVPEKILYGWVHAAAHAISPRAVSWKVQDAFRTGLPDQIVCIYGRVAWIESKSIRTSKAQVLGHSAPQYTMIRQWVDAGGKAGLLVAWDGWLYFIDGCKLPPPTQVVTPNDIMSIGFPNVMRDECTRAGCERLMRIIT